MPKTIERDGQRNISVLGVFGQRTYLSLSVGQDSTLEVLPQPPHLGQSECCDVIHRVLRKTSGRIAFILIGLHFRSPSFHTHQTRRKAPIRQKAPLEIEANSGRQILLQKSIQHASRSRIRWRPSSLRQPNRSWGQQDCWSTSGWTGRLIHFMEIPLVWLLILSIGQFDIFR